MRSRPAWFALALVAGTCTLAAGIAIQSTDISATWGEIVDVSNSLAIQPSGVAVSALGQAAAGDSPSSPVELAVVLGTASPGVTAGHYAYSATLSESSVGALGSGTFEAELLQDDVSQGSVWFTQGLPDVLAVEAVALVWDVGTSLPSGAVTWSVQVTAT
ncbi:MAG TPA: hypothetical protein VI997_12655 [Candidatus Thermoplasmatota archaeon]|nr:hypothetical protein [Candidatus Thermoplasmatota archaeon]